MLNRANAIHIPYTTSSAETLKEMLDFYEITQSEFAERIGVTQKHVSDLLNRKRFLSSELAVRIEKVTGVSAKMLLTLDMNYHLFYAEKEELRLKTKQAQKNNFLKPFEWAVA